MMGEAAQESQTTQEVKTSKPETPQSGKPKISKKPIIITIVIAVVLIITLVAGVYLWQQSKVRGLTQDNEVLEDKMASQSAQLATLKKEKTDLESKVNFLEKSLKEATASMQIEMGELTLSVGEVKHWPGVYFDPKYDKNNFLLVDVTIKNETEQILYLSLLNFKLKDTDNKAHPHYTTSAVASQPRFYSGIDDLPKGKIELRNQQVNAGETIVGTLIFYVPMNTDKYTLVYNDKSFPLTAE